MKNLTFLQEVRVQIIQNPEHIHVFIVEVVTINIELFGSKHAFWMSSP